MSNHWETILASVDITIGEHHYHTAIIRRSDSPQQSYYVMNNRQYHPFDGKGDDTVATMLGMMQIGILLGQELDDYALPKGPVEEQ